MKPGSCNRMLYIGRNPCFVYQFLLVKLSVFSDVSLNINIPLIVWPWYKTNVDSGTHQEPWNRAEEVAKYLMGVIFDEKKWRLGNEDLLPFDETKVDVHRRAKNMVIVIHGNQWRFWTNVLYLWSLGPPLTFLYQLLADVLECLSQVVHFSCTQSN